MKKTIAAIFLLASMANSLFAWVAFTGNDTNIVLNAPSLPYDIETMVPSVWEEAFVIPPPAGYPGTENRVCIRFDHDPDPIYMYTVSEAWSHGYQATKVDGDSRTEIPRTTLTHNGNFIEGDAIAFVDGDKIYLTGAMASASGWEPIIDIYESPMVPANGEDFDFTYKQTYDPGTIDPDFDYYMVGGQIAIKEGSNYVFTFAAYRVPEGQPATYWGGGDKEIQTQFYQMAHKDAGGNFVWDGLPRMINAWCDRSTLNGSNLGTVTVPQNHTPRSWQSWGAPWPGEQILGIHLNGDIFEIDGERWFYWVWFDGGNHIASARLADGFTFADSNPNKMTWHEDWPTLNIVQNSNPISGEQGINENATVFKRNGIYYFIFTHGHVVGNYSMSYIMGNSFETIARGGGTEHKLYEAYPDLGDSPLHTPGRREIAGSGRAITKSNGDMFMFYGIGTYDKKGIYLGRKTHYSKLAFNPDGTIVPFKLKPAIGGSSPLDPLFTDSDGVNLFTGNAGGMTAFEHNGATYNPEGGCDAAAVDIAAVSGGMHVISDSGLTFYSYDAAVGQFIQGGSYGWGAGIGRAVAVAGDGTVYAGGSTGFGEFTYSGDT